MKKQVYSKSIGLMSLILVAFQLSMLTSCDEWLDVKPKTQIESTDMFSSETGFKDALNGVYIKITSSSMYGREMTYGFVDVIGDMYYGVYSNTNYSQAKNHNYTYTGVETMINSIWQNSYNAIATLNEFLNQMEAADKGSFSRDNYNVMKGEALGLRAFLHFDLLRLFAKAPVVDPNAEAIPYVTTYSSQITPTSSVSATLDQVIADLQAAADLLKQSDPIITGREITASDDNGYLMDRQFHMNYYAVKAILARAYLYKGDKSNARQCAQEVINSGKFTWTPVESIATANDSERDRTFTPEQVFALQCDNLYSYIDPTIYGSTLAYSARLYLYSSWLNNIWPTATHSTDWRRVYFITNQGTSSSYNYTSTKLLQEGMNANYTKRMPIIRLPEMYLILAECDVPNAATQLNIIREHRGVTAPVTLTDETALQNEITMEYYREFIHEGQLFYRYKRINADKHYTGYYFRLAAFNPNLYVLPMPAEEIEFGNRNNE